MIISFINEPLFLNLNYAKILSVIFLIFSKLLYLIDLIMIFGVNDKQITLIICHQYFKHIDFFYVLFLVIFLHLAYIAISIESFIYFIELFSIFIKYVMAIFSSLLKMESLYHQSYFFI